jgi:FAD/FMN-containing dehydrogenase
MPCPGTGSLGALTSAWMFQNWSRTRLHAVPVAYRPMSVQELVACVQLAERDPQGVVRAVGTGWSYPDVAIAPEVTVAVQTDALNRVLSGTDPASMGTLIPFALNDANRALLQRYVHVEAGIKVWDLNCKLDALGLALETLGGSSGQSVAGAFSTSTHGSTFDLRPIADQVRAIHLIGPGGQEWWIERLGARAITDRRRMEEARDAGRLCQDVRIVYDDLLFNAVLASVGRMGIVYSYVVEVVPAFLLKQEKRRLLPWQDVASIIRMHRDEAAYTGPLFMDVTVDSYKRVGIITAKNRASVTDTPTPENTMGVFKFVCDIQAMNALLVHILGLIPAIIATATAAAIATVSPLLLLIPGAFEIASTAAVTAATAGIVALQSAVIAAITTPGNDLTQKMTSIINSVVFLGQQYAAPGLKDIVPQLVDRLVRLEQNPEAPEVVGKSFRLFTGQKECPSFEAPGECLRQIDGLEFALDLSPGSEKLFGFMQDVFELTDEFLTTNMPQVYGISLRFTKATEALIGMQQFSHTCHAEFFFLRGITGAADFYQRLYAIARRHDAIPHWGLIHEVDRVEIERLYGARLHDWRMALRRLIDEGDGRDGTFSTSYSVTRGLEPAPRSKATSDISYLVPLLLSPAPRSETTSDISYLVPLLLSN